ncbi:hypothetical protein CEXT_809731 [Caerostris extrusa]|uniref:Uncharacterized protein n=1 Tax=Caerostris extrusa TaxID=172846 RepID=A0AAV4V3T3_CAEEX|nr:hypothetical protein CEXT_809731 [Caerostris extrusa]
MTSTLRNGKNEKSAGKLRGKKIMGYRSLVKLSPKSSDLVMARVLKFWQWPDLLYWNSKTGRDAAYHIKSST